MLNFYDFEVFKYDWMVVIINPVTEEETVIINDREQLERYHAEHERDIWIGYNSSRYDQFILKGILCGFDPKKINDYIIKDGKSGYQYSQLFRKIKLINYDISTRVDRGLKVLEGFMGNNIKESTVPFDIDRKLTPEEIAETIKYCRHDVEQTMEVFVERKADFDASMALVNTFGLPIEHMTKTKAQLSAIILDATRKSHDDEFDIQFAPTIKIEKYKEVYNWFKKMTNLTLENVGELWSENAPITGIGGKDKIPKTQEELTKFIYSQSLNIYIAGVPHVFAWGGIHGAIPKYYGEGYFVNVDVASYYPSMIIRYGWMSRNCASDEKYREIYHTRLEMKAAGKKKEQLPYKTLLNGTYGTMKDKFNPLYDPRQANNICINGQLLLLDLIEKLEPHFQIIQSNTDGVLIKMNKAEDFSLLDDICYEWEQRTGMTLEFDEFKRVFQKDVNNYLMVDYEGKYKSKGAYVKELSNLDYDMAIVNQAIVDYMTKDISVETTINACDDLRKFQRIVKVTGKFLYGIYNNEILNDKCFRVFASTRPQDGGIFKVKSLDKNPEKFLNTPDKCFIDNDNVKDKKVPPHLDKSWYIDIAKKRLTQFGVL